MPKKGKKGKGKGKKGYVNFYMGNFFSFQSLQNKCQQYY